jgi:hypothetical protein
MMLQKQRRLQQERKIARGHQQKRAMPDQARPLHIFNTLIGTKLCGFQLWWLIGAACSHFGTAAIAAADVTRLFVEFSFAHFLLHAGMFNQLAEPTHCFVDTFIITQTQLNHKNPPLDT